MRKSINNIATDRSTLNRSLSPKDDNLFAKQFQSVEATMVMTEPPVIAKKNCIKYSTVRDQKSEEKIESLGKMEVQYLRLKERAHLPQQFLPSIPTTKRTDPAVTISH